MKKITFFWARTWPHLRRLAVVIVPLLSVFGWFVADSVQAFEIVRTPAEIECEDDHTAYIRSMELAYAGNVFFMGEIARRRHLITELAPVRGPCSRKFPIIQEEYEQASDYSDQESIRRMAESEDIPLRKLAGGNIHAPMEILKKLAKDQDILVRASVAMNKKIPSEVADLFVHEADSWVIDNFLKNNAVPQEAIDNLARDITGRSDDELRASVLSEPPYGGLFVTADDLRSLVASSRRVSPDVLRLLLKDSPIKILKLVAANPNTAATDLRELAKHPQASEHLVKYAETRLYNGRIELLEMSYGDSHSLRNTIASNPSTPTDMLVELLKDPDPFMPYMVAVNSSTPTDMLVEFSKNANSFMKFSLAQNPSTPADILRSFSDTKNLQTTLASNPSTPTDVLDAIALNPYSDYIPMLTALNNKSTSLQAVLKRIRKNSTESATPYENSDFQVQRVSYSWSVQTIEESTIALVKSMKKLVETRPPKSHPIVKQMEEVVNSSTGTLWGGYWFLKDTGVFFLISKIATEVALEHIRSEDFSTDTVEAEIVQKIVEAMHYDYREFRYEQIEAPIPLNSCEFSDPIFASRFCRANPQPATGFIPLIIEGRLPIVKNMDRLLTKKLQSKNISDFSDKYAFYKGVFCKLQTAAGKLDPDSKKATILYLMGEYIAKKYKILRTCDL